MERTSRELVRDTLEFKNTDGRVPRQLWTLPWADLYHHDALQKSWTTSPGTLPALRPSMKNVPKRKATPTPPAFTSMSGAPGLPTSSPVSSAR